jgi:AcrR family transcriptional regulator
METSTFLNNKLSHLRHLWDCRCPLSAPTDKSAETREKILMAAFEEIYSYGFQAASLSNILKNTGATKGALYHHFKSKKELGYAVLDEVICPSYQSSWVDPLKTTDDPITTMTTLLLGSVEQMTDEDVFRGCPLNNLAQEMSPIDPDFRERIRQAYNEWQQALEQALDRGKAAGNVVMDVDSKSVSLLAVASFGGFMGMAKNMQSLDILAVCVKGYVNRMEASRPK